MQYWIFYQAGVGGDGFGNLLEHASNIYPADGQLEWRIHYYENQHEAFDRPVRFYQSKWANDPLPFRYNTLASNTMLNPVYVNLIEQQKNTVITAHNVYFDLINKFEYQDIVTKDQIKIHLYSDQSERVYSDLVIKRGTNIPMERFVKIHKQKNAIERQRKEYAIHIDIEQAWRDWDYMKSCMNQLGISLSKDVYAHYLTYIKERA